jgi:hypothetical protein
MVAVYGGGPLIYIRGSEGWLGCSKTRSQEPVARRQNTKVTPCRKIGFLLLTEYTGIVVCTGKVPSFTFGVPTQKWPGACSQKTEYGSYALQARCRPI